MLRTVGGIDIMELTAGLKIVGVDLTDEGSLVSELLFHLALSFFLGARVVTFRGANVEI